MKRKLSTMYILQLILLVVFSMDISYSDQIDKEYSIKANETSVHIYVYDGTSGDPVAGATVTCYEYWDTKAPTPHDTYTETTDSNGHCKFVLTEASTISYIFEAQKNGKYGSTGVYQSTNLPSVINITIN